VEIRVMVGLAVKVYDVSERRTKSLQYMRKIRRAWLREVW